jgi:hypothetical protein
VGHRKQTRRGTCGMLTPSGIVRSDHVTFFMANIILQNRAATPRNHVVIIFNAHCFVVAVKLAKNNGKMSFER